MKVPRLGAYGAIAVADLQTGGCHDLEPDPPAVAASAVRDHRRCRLTFTPTGARPQCSTSARRFPRVRVGRGVRLHSQQLLLQTFGFFNDTNYLTLFEMNLFAVDSYDGALLVGEYLEQPTSQDRRRNARKDSEYRSGPFIGNVALCQ